MRQIEIREANADLMQEIQWLLLASQCLMRAATGENPPANIQQSKNAIGEVMS